MSGKEKALWDTTATQLLAKGTAEVNTDSSFGAGQNQMLQCSEHQASEQAGEKNKWPAKI